MLNYNSLNNDWRIDATDVTVELGADTVKLDSARLLFRTSDK